ncbi:MAG: hypothetical protein AAF224_02020 [Pseudomonadota bacterium]
MADTDSLIKAAEDAFKHEFNAVIEIRATNQAPFFVDGYTSPPSVSATEPVKKDETKLAARKEGRAIWTASPETLIEIFARKKALESSYLSGRLLIGGDMSVMARLLLEAKQS